MLSCWHMRSISRISYFTVLDPNNKTKHLIVLTVATVTSLSSIAILIYSVVGPGNSVSNGVGGKAVLVKLIRILNLVPTMILVALFARKHVFCSARNTFFNGENVIQSTDFSFHSGYGP